MYFLCFFFASLLIFNECVQGRANRSSLITSRNNGRGIALSPLQTHSVVPVANSQDSDSPTSASSLPRGLKPLRLVSANIGRRRYCLMPRMQSTIIDAKYPSRPNNHSRMHSPSSNSVYSFHSGKFFAVECMFIWRFTLFLRKYQSQICFIYKCNIYQFII